MLTKHLVAALSVVLLLPAIAHAQEAIVITTAPIFLLPDPSRVPLRTAAVSTRLRVLEEQQDGWVKVEFRDPQFGPRIGYIEGRFLRIHRPGLEPMDLSVRETDPVQARPAPQHPVPIGASSVPHPHSREGVWFNIGLGLGSLGCEDCGARSNGLSGGLSLGTAVTDRFMFGVGTTGYSRSVGGDLLTVGTLDARLRYYFTKTGGGHVNFGIGLGSVSYAGGNEFGLGMMLGLGWDFRIRDNLSVTPFWNGFAMRNSNVDANVGQLGVGFTWH